MENKAFTRRRFIAAASAVAAAPWFVPGSAMGADGATAPSNRITLGFIGVGAMGQGHLRLFLGYPEARVLAVCDVDRWRRENGRRAVHETYTARYGSGGYQACEAYNDFRDLLARADIDAIVTATGDRWHALTTIQAAKAGKDVYCEKPISLTIRESRAMVEAIRRYGRVFQAGLQQRSAPEFRRAAELVLAGALGKMQVVYVAFPGTVGDVCLPAEPVPEGLDWELWLGPAPWRPYNAQFHPFGPPHGVVPWHFCRDFGGGNLTSNAVHSFDVVQWALGADDTGPVEIIPPETGLVPDLTYRYADGTRLVVVPWRLDPKKHEAPAGWNVGTNLQNFGALYVGERGWIHVGRMGFLESYPAEILKEPAVPNDHRVAVDNHHQAFLNAVRSRSRSACDVDVAARSTTVSHLGCIAHWTGRRLTWDPVREEFPGDDEANRHVGRPMREPWRL